MPQSNKMSPTGGGNARQHNFDYSFAASRQIPARQASLSEQPANFALRPQSTKRADSGDLPFVFDQDVIAVRSRTPVPFTAQTQFGADRLRAQTSAGNEVPQRFVQASAADPSHFRAEPVRERIVSAPIQPRATDVRIHIERDPQRTVPTFDVTLRFQFTMEPGSLR